MSTLPMPALQSVEPVEHPLPRLTQWCYPRDVADVLLATALRRGAGAIWIEPLEGAPHRASHRVTVERRRRTVATAVFGDGLGDAVIARFAMMTGLDLLDSGAQTGRSMVKMADRSVTLIATLRPTEHGLRAELRLIDDAANVLESDAVCGPIPTDLPSGFVAGAYRFDGVLGEGGMGVVYLAEHTLLQRSVAIKVLKRSLLDEDPDLAARFVREARTTARVKHPGIVDVLDVAHLPDGRPYIVMELVGGSSLADVVDNNGAISALCAVRIGRSIADALGAAHSAGVVHRDLSASNVFIMADGCAKLVDFGAARRIEEGNENPDCPEGMVMGTPWYMAPEQARGWQCTPVSDLYSLGVLVYEMLSGSVPFYGETAMDVARQHVACPAPVVTSPYETLPLQLEAMVARLLRKDPLERYQSAAELVEDLTRIELALERTGWRKWLPV